MELPEDLISKQPGAPGIWQEKIPINQYKMQNSQSPVNFDRIEEMSEGDAEFKAELVAALFKSLSELKEKYLEGSEMKDLEIISQIRHKVKPALALFEIDTLNNIIQEGKEIISEKGFNEDFMVHLEQFLDAVQEAIDQVESHLNQN
jgi:translation elongation factor EF-G